MSRLPQVGDDQTFRVREIERRLAEVEARGHRGLLADPVVLTANSSETSGGTVLDLANDITVTTSADRFVCLTFHFHSLVGTTQQDLFDIRLRENGTQVAAHAVQIHEVTGFGDGGSVTHTYIPTTGSRTFDCALVRVGGGGTAHLVASSASPATFTVEDVT